MYGRVRIRIVQYHRMGTHFTRDMCFPGRGTHITSGMRFPVGGTHIASNMCSPTRETHITSDMFILALSSKQLYI